MRFRGHSTILAVLVALIFAFGASRTFAGSFQRTRDGRTVIWNADPKPGDAAAWSGKRDSDGYATGEGKLTWYRPGNKSKTTGTSIATAYRYEIKGEYIGTMEHGKLHQEGDAVTIAKKEETAAKVKIAQKPGSVPSATPPAKGKKTEVVAKSSPAVPDKPVEQDVPGEGPAAESPKSPEVKSGGLSSLAAPPSSIHLREEPTPSPSPSGN